MRRTAALLMLATLLAAPIAPAAAESCTADTFRTIVDEAGRALRRVHEEMQPRLDASFRRLKTKRGWSEEEYLDKASELIADDRSEAFDAKASELIARLDRLAEVAPGSAPDCSRVGELEATVVELTATVRGKLRHMLTRLDAAVGEAAPAAASTAAPAPPEKSDTAAAEPPPAAIRPSIAEPGGAKKAQPPAPTQAPPPPAAKGKAPPEKVATPSPAAPPASAPPPTVQAAPERRPASSGWTTSTVDQRAVAPPAPVPPAAAPPIAAPPPPAAAAPPVATRADDEFSLDEIREASRGFFGTLSSELAGVIEHAFSVTGGRPTGYVLGSEGGGAFVAGVRYGRGTLFTRTGASRQVYWHGPSIGYDFGASGSKTLFLVYRMTDPLDIFNGFSGVDGSAYLVGGVGMTLLTDGRLVLAPIRTGIGLRLGASIGYIRFTPRPTWNPF